MKNKPKVSILCLTYNHENYIKQAIDSFISQKTNFDFEILIHDDASTDKTSQIIKEYQKKYPEVIKPIFQKENQYSKKIYGLFNKFLLPKAKGEYIALCEGDDYWCDPLKLQTAVDALDNNLDCIMYCHNTYVVDQLNDKKELMVKDIKLSNNKFSLTNSIYTHLSARVFRNIKNLPPGDIFMYHYLLSKGSCYYNDKPMSVYRYSHKGVWSSLSKDEQEKENIKTYYLLDLLFKKKYNSYYFKSMPLEFEYFYKNFSKELSWILFLKSKKISFSDVYNYKTKFIKFPLKEIFLWKLIDYVEKNTSFSILIQDKIIEQQVDNYKIKTIIDSLKLILFFKICQKLFVNNKKND